MNQYLLIKEKINIQNIELFIEFLKNNKSKHFRYFEKRNLSVIEYHLYTSLYFYENHLIGYGHLEKEDGKTWLGIIVANNFKRKGFGKQIVQDLIKNSIEDVYLSVDLDNFSAFNLYEKMGFQIHSKSATKYFMFFKHSSNKNII